MQSFDDKLLPKEKSPMQWLKKKPQHRKKISRTLGSTRLSLEWCDHNFLSSPSEESICAVGLKKPQAFLSVWCQMAARTQRNNGTLSLSTSLSRVRFLHTPRYAGESSALRKRKWANIALFMLKVHTTFRRVQTRHYSCSLFVQLGEESVLHESPIRSKPNCGLTITHTSSSMVRASY